MEQRGDLCFRFRIGIFPYAHYKRLSLFVCVAARSKPATSKNSLYNQTMCALVYNMWNEAHTKGARDMTQKKSFTGSLSNPVGSSELSSSYLQIETRKSREIFSLFSGAEEDRGW